MENLLDLHKIHGTLSYAGRTDHREGHRKVFLNICFISRNSLEKCTKTMANFLKYKFLKSKYSDQPWLKWEDDKYFKTECIKVSKIVLNSRLLCGKFLTTRPCYLESLGLLQSNTHVTKWPHLRNWLFVILFRLIIMILFLGVKTPLQLPKNSK